MAEPIADIENGIDKLDRVIRTLRDERDKARADASVFKSSLDERELELLQMDEERQKERASLNEQLAQARLAKEDLEKRLAEVAAKVRGLMPLVDEFTGGGSPGDRT
jgi:uncharacterized coiled-coil DUF342 family protein